MKVRQVISSAVGSRRNWWSDDGGGEAREFEPFEFVTDALEREHCRPTAIRCTPTPPRLS